MKSIESIDKTTKSIVSSDSIDYGVYSVRNTEVHGGGGAENAGGENAGAMTDGEPSV